MCLTIRFRDAHILVLDKPPGLLSVPGIGPENQACLARQVAAAHPTARIVHRLDRETSGLIVMALDAEAHRALSRQFEERRVGKRYVAVVDGVVGPDEGRIDLPLRKDLDNPPRHMVDPRLGKPAQTGYRVLERRDDRTRVAFEPRTGRSHQLRLHALAMGHAILGDDLYAPPEVAARAPRLMLHAESITFEHPSSGERLTVESPAPF